MSESKNFDGERQCPACGNAIPRLGDEYPWQYNRRRYCSRACGTKAGNRARAVPVKDRLRQSMTVNEESGCWEWTGPLKPDGYGRITINGRPDTVHRAAYREWVGIIPDGMLVCHRCDNRRCINPLHLFTGTNADNTADRNAKGRQARGEGGGRAKLTEAQVLAIRESRSTNTELARQYGVGETTIHHVKTGGSWSHV